MEPMFPRTKKKSDAEKARNWHEKRKRAAIP
jgi:hypothetical protein